MDYEPNDTIDLSSSPSGLIFRFICQDNKPTADLLRLEHWNKGLESCPSCGSSETAASHIGHCCFTCGLVWKAELGASCIECGRGLQPISSDVLKCDWCGQVWELETIKDSYILGDHDSQIDWSTPKGVNS